MIWRLGVVGEPIEHSLSPVLHRAGLAQAGLAGTSTRVSMRDIVAGDLRGLMGAHFDALSVTMPLKEAAVSICTELDAVASRTGVVNSLLARGDRVLGANTDGPGLVAALLAQFSLPIDQRRIVVLGAGGAARGIVDAFVEAGAAAVTVLGRTAANVERLTSRYENVDDYPDADRPVDLIVNTLPVEARTTVDEWRVGVNDETVAIDVTYEPRMSPWRAAMESRGCRSANGLGMLAYQAALQMGWWWNRDIDGAPLLEAIR